MPPMITPSVTPNASGQPVSQGGTRSRNADEAQGRSFGAALDRSRNGNTAKAQDGSTDVATIERKPLRKPEPAEDTKDALPPDPNLAFLATAHTPLHALTLAGRTAAQDGRTSDAPGVPVAAGVAADIPVDTAVQDAQAKTPPGTMLVGADTQATPEAAFAAKDVATEKAAAPVAQKAPPDTDAAPVAPPASLQDLARAAVAAQTVAVGNAKPASTPAGAPVGTAASGRAGASRTAMSATTAEQLAAATQPKAAEEAKSVVAPTAAVLAAASGDHTDATATATPVALQQPAAVTTSSERAADASATRGPLHTIAPEVGSDKWAPALGQQLARMSVSGTHTAELNLNPAGLGPLKVTLSMGENQAQAMFVSAHESVRKAIEAALPQLRTSLSEQGITLGQASVGAETRQPFGQDAAFAQQQQQQQQNAARQQQGPAYPGAGRIAASTPAAPVAAARTSLPGNAAPGVDTFA
ncbi:flagellar hook-length control protein FliK [Variovorax sp. PAMC26660]|uniref:flagellar hook-length control protein FliK n=1 Tax=Variovorax sp. PAMC26660 TaxID=2762322 RepID=UPI00164E28D8|nr:flagellar hook-length control protein FliK [Variovorax sp. PAMC26660]QNK68898.1 flagellar hook-length control protein FliK [Variovorax sp. PAMC26660]